MKKITIAIDGYSATGKSTLARELAQALDYLYIDSGALYRAITLFSLRHDMWPQGRLDRDRLCQVLDQIHLKFEKTASGGRALFLNGENVEAALRSMAVSTRVSKVAEIPEVRHYLLELQRALGAQQGVVMDGRDIGTVVFPQAALKIFMTASPEVRARRRYDELRARGVSVTLEEVWNNLKQRDKIDTARHCAPLKKARDAVEIDNDQLSKAQQLEQVLHLAAERVGTVMR